MADKKTIADYPELVKEWDYALNEKSPFEVSFGSEQMIHWVCEKGHKWEDSPYHRTHEHRKCPVCSNKKVVKGFNDLATTRPDLAKEWDYDKNILEPTEVFRGSVKKVWWKCPKCGLSYEMRISHRNQGNNCPYCSGKRVMPGYNDLESNFPEIAKEWNYEKNGDLLPSQITTHSNKKVWWKCPKGHPYLTTVNNRTGNKNNGCPVCSNKVIIAGINDLATTHPELVNRWDYEKNAPLTPQQIGAGSNRYVYWLCEHGHSFKSMVHSMTHSRKGMNCPVCRNFRVDICVNDLATTHPHLLDEWDYEKNSIKPTEVHAGMRLKAWWKCKKHGHSWCATIQSRAVQGKNCPICSNQKLLKGFNDVGTLCPEIYNVWDFEKNNGKTPADFAGLHSNKKVYLKCEHGHSYSTTISDFTRGYGCPICSNKQVLAGFNDLATTHPQLAKEWDYEKNKGLTPQQITYGSDKKAWWKCERGHSWHAVISSRAAGRGCPECLKEYQVSLTEKTFAFYLSKHFSDLKENVHLKELGRRELDIYVPSLKLAVEYDGHNWHKNPNRDLLKDKLCEANGITLIRIREKDCVKYESPSYFIDAPQSHGNVLILKDTINCLFELINKVFSLSLEKIDSVEPDISSINESFYSYTKSNSLAAKCPELLKEWDYEKNGDLKPEFISAGSNTKVWWKCEHGHSWNAVVSSRVRGNGCPFCSGRYLLKGFNDLESQFPDIAKQWDIDKNNQLKPDSVYYGSNKKVWWKCEHGHSWQTAISTRTRMKSGCPVCSGLIADKGKNDFETLYPELAKEWDYEKNGNLKPSDFLPGSERVVWWKCPKGHSYDTQIAIRAKMKCGCPICSNKRILKGYNDLETLHPELVKEWDYEKNGDLLPSQVGGSGGSHKEIWWKCKHGHSWKTKISTRIHLHTGCPQCAIERSRKKKI